MIVDWNHFLISNLGAQGFPTAIPGFFYINFTHIVKFNRKIRYKQSMDSIVKLHEFLNQYDVRRMPTSGDFETLMINGKLILIQYLDSGGWEVWAQLEPENDIEKTLNQIESLIGQM